MRPYQPFLLSLGLAPSLVSLVWLVGPLCGAFLQPYIGFKSDSCSHAWGRRKPFIIYGALGTVVCLNGLSWTEESILAISNIFGVNEKSPTSYFCTISLSILWTVALNVCVQPVQAGLRALIVDCTPPGQQEQANAFASSAILTGSVIGFAYGFVDLPKGPAWLSNGDFKCLCLIAGGALGLTVTMTCIVVKEPMARSTTGSTNKRGARKVYNEILTSMVDMPQVVKRVCFVQFFSWLAWFPFLFYVTT